MPALPAAGTFSGASSEAWLVEPATAEGFDTFWYTCAGVNAGTGLLP